MTITVIGGGKPYNNTAVVTTSGAWVVPAGVYRARLRGTGGGAGGGGAYCGRTGAYFDTERNVTPGESLTIAIGAGGVATMNGGSTSIIGSFGTVTAIGGAATTYPGYENSILMGNIGHGGGLNGPGVAGGVEIHY